MYVYLLPKLPLLKITYHSNVTFPTVKCQRRHCRRYTQQNCTVQRSRVGLQSSQLILVFMLFHSPHNDNVSSVTCLLSVTIMMTKTICQSHSKLSLRGKSLDILWHSHVKLQRRQKHKRLEKRSLHTYLLDLSLTMQKWTFSSLHSTV